MDMHSFVETTHVSYVFLLSNVMLNHFCVGSFLEEKKNRKKSIKCVFHAGAV